MVVSYWEPMPGREEAFKATSDDMTDILRREPGVCLIETFRSGDKYIAVHGYEDEAAYRSIIDNPDGVFSRAMRERGGENDGRWLYSERGETQPHKGMSDDLRQ